MRELRLGAVTSAVGLRGELRVYPYTDYKEKFEEIPYVLLNGEKRLIQKVRYHKNMAILKLEGVEDRSAAEACKGMLLTLPLEEMPPLPEDSYYVFDLKGCRVLEAGSGRELGVLADVTLGAAQDLYEVERPNGKRFLVPAVREFVKDVDLEAKTVSLQLIEGMMDED